VTYSQSEVHGIPHVAGSVALLGWPSEVLPGLTMTNSAFVNSSHACVFPVFLASSRSGAPGQRQMYTQFCWVLPTPPVGHCPAFPSIWGLRGLFLAILSPGVTGAPSPVPKDPAVGHFAVHGVFHLVLLSCGVRFPLCLQKLFLHWSS
jgi:hypothetical protein